MDPKGLSFLGIYLGIGIIAMAAALGIGKIASSSVESIARQPESTGQIRGVMIIACALIEGVCLFALVLCFLAQNKIQF